MNNTIKSVDDNKINRVEDNINKFTDPYSMNNTIKSVDDNKINRVEDNINKFTDPYSINYGRYNTINRIDDNNETFIYDIFARNKEIIIIAENKDIEKIKLYISDNLIGSFKKIHARDTIVLIFFKINENPTTDISVKVEYKNKTTELILYHIYLENPIKNIASTTQFKFDSFLISLYTEYYLNQGIDHIYLYYNGKLKESKINPKIFNIANVTIIEWDYPYAIDGKQYSQIGQMHHAYFKYSNLFYEYMLFNDLDEYIVTEDKSKIVDYVKKNNQYDGIVFHNVWAIALNKEIPCINGNLCTLPTRIYRDKNTMKYDYSNEQRTKFIYKSKRIIGQLDIHTTDTSSFINNTREFLVNDKNIFYHFMNWSPQLAVSFRQGEILNDVYIVDF